MKNELMCLLRYFRGEQEREPHVWGAGALAAGRLGRGREGAEHEGGCPLASGRGLARAPRGGAQGL